VALATQKQLKRLCCHLDGEWAWLLGRKNYVLDGHAHWRHVANMVERWCMAAMSGSVTTGGDTACSQITFGNLIFVLCKLCILVTLFSVFCEIIAFKHFYVCFIGVDPTPCILLCIGHLHKIVAITVLSGLDPQVNWTEKWKFKNQ